MIESRDRKPGMKKGLVVGCLAAALLLGLVCVFGLFLMNSQLTGSAPPDTGAEPEGTQPAAGLASTSTPPRTPDLSEPSGGGGSPPTDELSVEASEDARINEEARVGEYSLVYSPWMRPGSGDTVLLTVIIPEELIDLDVLEVRREDISPESAAVLGGVEADRGNLYVDHHMRVELDSLTIQVQNEYPAVQELRYEPNTPTYWAWSVLAPMEEGFHRLNLKVFLDEDSDHPSWFRSYQVEVLLPSPTPLPTSTAAPSPTPTQVPEDTATPTPTQTALQRFGTTLVAESSRIFIDLLPSIIALLTAVGGLLVAHLRRRDRIRELERSLPFLESEVEKIAANAELQRLKEIRWWQFWKLTDRSR